ncbi:GNAT family N-acetyltransferase [uncultured Tateyamaria sp.]|uniref:GNAT family N-acetyltransferase n=1 Tax=uncultured Tateyamaria sp. TaxID=455651 RepID=UPI002604BB07|nr:GNAT family N-acetyltransferase [uncultured Tateyamaria sp.]
MRRLTAGDAAQWRTIRLDALEAFPDAFLTTYAEAAAVPLDRTATWLERGQSFGVFVSGTLVATGSLARENRRQTRHRGSIGPFFVKPGSQGQGFADPLMEAMIAAAQAAGMWQLELQVAASNTRAIRFYQRHGFEACGRIPNATVLDGVHETDLLLIRSDPPGA